MKSPIKKTLPVRGSSLTGKVRRPWDFSPSDADQRAGPSPAAGTYYGTGFKQPIGRMRDTSSPGMNPVSKKQLGTPPKSVV